MKFSSDTSCLLLVDFQSRLMPAIVDATVAVANARRLAGAARLLHVPVFATEQNSRGLGETVAALSEFSEKTFPKTHFDATKESAWPGFLPVSRKHVVVTGSEAHVCVLQTVMGLLDLGHPVRLVIDAVGSRTLENRNAGLHRAEKHGAELVTTEMVLFEWLESCNHPQFRPVLQFIK